MENHSIYSGRRLEAADGLRRPLAAESLAGPSPSLNPSGNTWGSNRGYTSGVPDGRRESAPSINSSSRSHRATPSGAERPTSPAFMKLLSQRSPKTPPSDGSRSPTVMSRLAGRRRVSSPTIVARAWLDASSPSPSQAPSAHALEIRKEGTAETHHPHTVLSRSRGRSERKKGRDESKELGGRPSSSRGHGRRRKSHSNSRQETQDRRRKEGTVLSPIRRTPEERLQKGLSRPPPKRVTSPRRLPPPTFEKILLGLVDDDFTTGNDEVDVFSAETKQQQKTAPPFANQTEEECISVSVDHADCLQDEGHNSTAFTPHSSARSSLDTRYESYSQQDGVIPEHYLYIPPLRLCGNSGGERRPVPALMQPTEDEGQVSVREDRRHIATLFSLEAAESHAQKARLQEQLKETSPFRLTEVVGPCTSQSDVVDGVEIIGPPPGKSKRRQRSTLLETIVREHDWESEGQALDENIRIYAEQTQQSQASEASRWQFFASDEELEGESARPELPDGGLSSPRATEQASLTDLDLQAAAAQASDSREMPQEECGSEDVPGAFDAVWGRSACLAQAANDCRSKASSHSDSWEDLHELYKANGDVCTMRRMVDFLSHASLHSEDGGADSGGGQDAALAEDSDASFSNAATATEGSSSAARAPTTQPAAVQLDGDPKKEPVLRSGEPGEWEVRYSTADGLSNSAEQSPFNCKGAMSADLPMQEDTTQRAFEDQNQTVEFEEEQEMREDTHTQPSRYLDDREASSGQFPEEPPTAASREQAGGPVLDPTRMSSYSSTRLFSMGSNEPSRSASKGAPTGHCLTSELQLAAAALDTRLRSVQSIANEEAPTKAAASRSSPTFTPRSRRTASRKRRRPLKEEGIRTSSASSYAGGRADEEWGGSRESKCVSSSATQAGGVENCLSGHRQIEGLLCRGLLTTNRAELPATAAGALAPATAGADAAAEPWARVKEHFQADALKPPNDTNAAEADAWHEGSTVPAHDAEHEGDGQGTSRRDSSSLCEGNGPGPFRHSVSLPPSRAPDPAVARSTEVVEAINRAISGCAYGPRVHLLLLSCMFLAVWALLLVIYLFDRGRGPRLFVGLAVALSFVISLCMGAVQMTASLFKWKALKCSLDLDLRERIFASMKRLREPENEGLPSMEGMGECGKLLQLLCASFIDLLTQGSPRLDVIRTMERRHIAANAFAGLLAAAFIAGLARSGQAVGASSRFQFQAGDAVAVVVALLYSVLLLVLSYSLATPPTPAAVRRAVDKHSNFQYLWSLKFADFLLDRRAVTPKSVQDLCLRSMDVRHSCLLVSTLNRRPFKQEGMPAICFRGVSNPFLSKYTTAKAVLHPGGGVSFDWFQDLQKGQRVLITLTSAPRRQMIGRSTAAPSVYLNLVWCGRRTAPEELRIPMHSCALSVCGEVAATARKHDNASTSVLVQYERPQDVMCNLLGMLQEDTTGSFVNSKIRRYLSEAERRVSPASCEFPLVLHIPTTAFTCGKRWHCDPSALEFASSCCMLSHLRRLGWRRSRGAAQKSSVSAAPVEEHLDKNASPKDKLNGSKTSGKVGPWQTYHPLASAATSTRSVQMHAFAKHMHLNTLPTVPDTGQAVQPRAGKNGSAQASEAFASLTLFFASEEQRQEFRRCMQEASSA